MKRSRIAIFFISALGFVMGLAPSSPLYAQTQSQPQPAACPLDGPSIADTLKYINDALVSQSFAAGGNGDSTSDNFSLAISESQVTLSWNLTYGPSWRNVQNKGPYLYKSSFAIYNIDCHAQGTPGDSYRVSASCATSNTGCVSFGAEGFDGSWMTLYAGSGFDMTFAVDAEKGQRLARAFSHLIALQQQQYKQSHSDPNDPFAKPQ
jgi:hypothetical protein